MEDNTLPFNPVEIQLGATAYYVSPGGRQEIPFVLTNRTDREDYFELSLQGVPAEWIQLDFPVLQVGAGERREASLTLQPPEGAEGTYPAVLRAASQNDANLSSEVTFDLRVVSYEKPVPGTSADFSAGRNGLEMDNSNYHVVPGSSAAIHALLTNRGLFEDTFQLSLDGLPIGWISTPTPAVRLLPGEQREIIIYIQPPQTPASRAGRYPFTLQVASQMEPGQTAIVEGTLTLTAFSQFTSDLTPRHIDAGQSARLRIQNLGNIPSTYLIHFRTPNGDLEFVPSISGPVQIQPGDVVSVDFAVSPRNPNLFGNPITLPYTLVVHSSEGDAQAHNGEVFSRALIPVWVLPAMLTLCLGLLCSLGFLWNWNQERITQATTAARDQFAAIEASTATAVSNQTAAAFTGQEDTDGDGLINEQEISAGTNLNVADSDHDRVNDGDETRFGLNPLNPDSDGDGFLDGLDLNPLDPANTSLTATAQLGQPVSTNTPPPPMATLPPIPTNSLPPPTPTPTAPNVVVPPELPTDTPHPPPPTATITLPAPTATLTFPPPTATFTLPVPTETPTTISPNTPTEEPIDQPSETREPLPITGENQIVFESNREGDSELYILYTADETLVRLTNSPGLDTQPSWSPDGSQVLFTSARDENDEIYVMNADGSNLVNLTNHPADDTFPAWSADGSTILFTTNRDGNQEVYRMSAEGADPQNLTNHPANDFAPFWYGDSTQSASTNQILFTSDRDENNEIYTMNADGTEPVNLSDHPASDTSPAAHPDGNRIAFVSERDGNSEVYVMDENGENPINVTNHPASDTMPAWAPGGEWIAFTTDRDGNQEIYITGRDGSDPANLTENPAEDQYAGWR